jgi:hypothetical protein
MYIQFSSWGAGLASALWILIFASILHIFFPTPGIDFMISIAGKLSFFWRQYKMTIARENSWEFGPKSISPDNILVYRIRGKK